MIANLSTSFIVNSMCLPSGPRADLCHGSSECSWNEVHFQNCHFDIIVRYHIMMIYPYYPWISHGFPMDFPWISTGLGAVKSVRNPCAAQVALWTVLGSIGASVNHESWGEAVPSSSPWKHGIIISMAKIQLDMPWIMPWICHDMPW